MSVDGLRHDLGEPLQSRAASTVVDLGPVGGRVYAQVAYYERLEQQAQRLGVVEQPARRGAQDRC